MKDYENRCAECSAYKDKLPESVPYIVYEAALYLKERYIKRLWALVFVLSIAVSALSVAVIR